MEAMSETAISIRELGTSKAGLQVPLTGPSNDIHAASLWLAIYSGRSPHTFRTYRKEVKRWLAFLEMRYGPALPSYLKIATEDDAQAYLLAMGRPKELRSGPSEVTFEPTRMPVELLAKYGIRDQPFLIEHLPRSMAHALSSISALYKFLCKPLTSAARPYVTHNPTSRLGQMQSRTAAKAQRMFTPRIYHEMLTTIGLELAAAKTKTQALQAKRKQWLITCVFGLWIRIAETASLSMGSFRREGGMWMVTVFGKGRKERSIVVTTGVIQALAQYRLALGLPSLPHVLEPDIPAIRPLSARGKASVNRHCDPSSLYREIKAVAFDTAMRLDVQTTDLSPADHDALIRTIKAISPHWFRHSGVSEAINSGFPLADAADRLGHADVNTTHNMYFHGENKRALSALESIEKDRATNATALLQ
jgi:site-specific recombinase XerD